MRDLLACANRGVGGFRRPPHQGLRGTESVLIMQNASHMGVLTSSHCAVSSLSGHSTARTLSSSTSAAVPGRLPSPAALSLRRYLQGATHSVSPELAQEPSRDTTPSQRLQPYVARPEARRWYVKFHARVLHASLTHL